MLSERELLKRIAEDDQNSFRTIFNEHSSHVYGLALRLTRHRQLAEDITQDVFCRIWCNRSSLPDILYFRSYLNTITRNLILDHFKKKMIIPVDMPELPDYCQDTADGPETAMDVKELQQGLQSIIHQLSPQLKMAFTLSRQEGLTHNQIADRMNISVLTSKSHLVRALAFIKDSLREKKLQ